MEAMLKTEFFTKKLHTTHIILDQYNKHFNGLKMGFYIKITEIELMQKNMVTNTPFKSI